MGNLNRTVTSRIEEKMFNDFKMLAKKIGKTPPQLIREFIEAILDNRMKITRSKSQKCYDNVYS